MKKFAFVVHPLHVRDVARKYKAAALLPDGIVKRLLHLIPTKPVSHITGIESIAGARTEGWFIGCPLTADQLKNGDQKKAVDKIVEAGMVAQNLGADIVGLGAFTSIAGDAGVTVAERLDIGVTTGNSYTVATALEGSLKAARVLGRDPADCTLAILGATGSIGRLAALMLAPRVARTVLSARSEGPLRDLVDQVADKGAVVELSTDVNAALKDADIVIAVTSAIEAVVQPEMLKTGAVVCDVARPRDVSVQVARKRKDVLVIEGGAVLVPGDVQFNFNFGFPPKEAYACMAETMILALEGKCGDYSLGRDIKIEQVEETAELGRKHGFELAGFRSFEHVVSDADIEQVRQAIKASSIC